VRRVLIVNPSASGVTEARVAAVTAALDAGGRVQKVLTERPGHATELVRDACRDAAAIFVLAGDGGFNEAVNGMSGSVPVGFLPGGATNVLPRALGLPRGCVAAARRLAAGERTRRISLGRVHYEGGPEAGRLFTFSAGLGLDAELVRAVDGRGRRRGRRSGDLAFVWELVRIVAARRGRFEPVLDVEGHGRCAFVVAANCDPYTYAGPFGVRAAPLARFELGLDVIGVERLDPLDIPRLAWWVLAHPTHPSASGVVSLHDADRVAIRCDRLLPLQVDGEDLGDVTELRLEAERDALTVLV
jgi:diacylglycerol kinase family enzyme